MDQDMILLDGPSSQKKNSFVQKPLASVHEYYLSGDVLSPEEYIEWFDQIRNAGPNDMVKIHINSPGGDLFTAIQFLRVVAECEAHVVTSVEGSCMSAATLIFINADSYEVSPHSVFMFHNYSTAMYGKGGELYDGIIHERKWSERLLREVYEDFLTEEEIAAILDNKDIWMDGEEVAQRLVTREKLNDKGNEKDVAKAAQSAGQRKVRKGRPPKKKVDPIGAGGKK